MKFRHLSILAILIMAVVLTACGRRVEVPPAAVGKVVTPSGYQKGVVTTSQFRLPVCMPWQACAKLVLLSTADTKRTQDIHLFMPQDRLSMDFTVKLTLTPNPDKYTLLFNKLPPKVNGSGQAFISMEDAYQVYAEPIIATEAKDFLSQYSIDEIAGNRDTVSKNLSKRLTEILQERTPLLVKYAALSNVEYPTIIVEAQQRAAEQRENIRKERAKIEVAKVRYDRKLKEQQMKRKVDVEKAHAESQVNQILGDSITSKYVTYRQLNALDAIARSNNTKFVPSEMLSSMAGQVMLGNEAQVDTESGLSGDDNNLDSNNLENNNMNSISLSDVEDFSDPDYEDALTPALD